MVWQDLNCRGSLFLCFQILASHGSSSSSRATQRSRLTEHVLLDKASCASFAPLLNFYAGSRSVSGAKILNSSIIQNGRGSNAFLASLVLPNYSKSNTLKEAYMWFQDMEEKNTYSWNIMISAFARNDHNSMPIQLFEVMMMQEGAIPDRITFIHALSGCISHVNLVTGKKMHVYIIYRNMESDIITSTSLISMYDRCGSLRDAREVFHRMPIRNVVTWNAMLSAYSHHGCDNMRALQFFNQMLEESMIPNRVTYICILDACVRHVAVVENKNFLAMTTFCGFQTDVTLATAAISLYGKCGCLSDASDVFDKISGRNVVSWNALMAVFAQNGCGEDVRSLYAKMQKEGITPDDVSFLCCLSVCVLEDGSLTEGKILHSKIMLTGFESNTRIATGIVNMYGKCGSLEDAIWTFDRILKRDVISWSAMIAAYAQHGYGENALQLFYDMVAHGTKPDEVTYLNILIACSHGGLIEQALHFWLSIIHEQHILPIAEHHECLIDLLGRAGRIDEAELIVEKFYMHNQMVPLMILLRTCKNLFDLKRAQRLTQHIFDLYPDNVSAYVMLSNFLSESDYHKLASE